MFHVFRKQMDHSIKQFLALPGRTYCSTIDPDTLWLVPWTPLFSPEIQKTKNERN